MDEIIAIEVNREDWIEETQTGLYYQRGLRGLDATDAINYCWNKLDCDEQLRDIFGRYVTEYSFHISELIDEFDPDGVDTELLDDVFHAICLEQFGVLNLNKSNYNFHWVKIAIEGLHHYLINDHDLHELMTYDVISIWKNHEQFYFGIGTRD